MAAPARRLRLRRRRDPPVHLADALDGADDNLRADRRPDSLRPVLRGPPADRPARHPPLGRGRQPPHPPAPPSRHRRRPDPADRRLLHRRPRLRRRPRRPTRRADHGRHRRHRPISRRSSTRPSTRPPPEHRPRLPPPRNRHRPNHLRRNLHRHRSHRQLPLLPNLGSPRRRNHLPARDRTPMVPPERRRSWSR